MNRPIKFRAWDKSQKKMKDISLHSAELASSYRDESEYEVMQFTGLTDKNGKEIYEGDLLGWLASEERPAYLQQVKWDNDAAMFIVEDGGGHKSDFNHWPASEVIGNVFENPELLSV